jgi:hypothetical protein
MRHRIFTVTAIAIAMLAFHGCGDDKAAPTPAPATDTSKPATDAKPTDAAKPADAAKPEAAPAAPAK